MSLLLLHLSDLHVKGNDDPILKKADAIANALNGHVAAASLIVIVVSGDVAYSGAKHEYAAAKTFFERIRKKIKAEARCNVEFLISPGNHDCDFEINNSSRINNIAAVQANGSVDDSVIKSCTRIQNEFFRFRDTLETWKSVDGDRLWRTATIDVDGKKIVFDSLNVSWVSKLREDKNLFFPVSKYKDAVLNTQSDARFIAFHHPFNWFNQVSYRPFRRLLREAGSVLISGHEHEGNVGAVDEQESGRSAYVEGCVLQHDNGNLSGTGFFVLNVDLDSMTFTHTRYEYAGEIYSPEKSPRVWDLPVANTGKLRVANEFRRLLEDAGAISRPESAAPLTLQDIYVFPDLRRMHSRARTRHYIDAKSLQTPESTRGGVILECDDRMGSTSLLNQIFLSYLDQGFAPLLINGGEIKSAKPGHIDDILAAAVKRQYEASDVAAITQLSRTKKILLLDDLDDSKVRDASGRAQVLTYLRKLFDHLVVVTAKNFQIEEILENDTSRDLVGLEHYEIQPLGYSKRAELVKRWVSIGSSGIGSGELISECDRAERLISAAMHKSLIPSAPLYLLTLLQSVNTGRSTDLKESSLGHYYEFLLTEALLLAGVARAKLGEFYQYATYLAWEFTTKKASRLSRHDLRNFDDRFSAEFFKKDFDATLSVLLNAKILIESGDEYEFRYPYMFYHLKGRYLSANLNDESIREYVQRCCDHLYVRDYANTILFLAHHTSNDWFLETIKASASKLFFGVDPVLFDKETSKINEVISEAPALVYEGGTPEEYRHAKNKEKDDRDKEEGEDDGLMDAEEPSANLSLASQIVMLFKTTEILGQILKNQYSTIRRPTKKALLDTLFSGSLRALGSFYGELESSSDKLVHKIKQAIEKSGKEEDALQRERLARRFVAELVQTVSVGILGHAAVSVNSDDLADDISETVSENESYAYKILELAVNLDSAKPIPKGKLESLYEARKADIVVTRIIQMLVLQRLYMFKTSEADMRWIASKLGIPLASQHLIAYNNPGRQIK